MKAYIYRNVITFDTQELDDYIFNELSKYTKGYPDIEQEFRDNVESVNIDTAEELVTHLKNYKLLEGRYE